MRNVFLGIFCFLSLLISCQLFAESKNVELTIKGIDSDKQIELSGNSEWTFVNRKTNHVISVKGSNKGTKIKILNDVNDIKKGEAAIYAGDWLVSALSEPFAGLSTVNIRNNVNQSIDVNMVLKTIDVDVNMPDKAIAGTVEEITWKIPKSLDGKFTLQKKDEKPRFYAAPKLFTKVYKDSKYDLKIPAVPGEYLLRFYSLKNTKKIVFEKPLKVTSANITLNAPKEAIAGTEIDLTWVAPETSKAQINLKFARNKPDFNARFHVRTHEKTNGKLLLPSIPGDYVLRWFSTYDRKLMFEKPIKLLPQKVEINAPKTAKAGGIIDISWEAPPRSEGKIVIFPVKNDEKIKNQNIKSIQLVSTKEQTAASVKLPLQAGKYFLRFLNESDFFVAAEHHIELLEP